jgi:MarR family transcriptional regulator, transcriptional regulator for hemolysin
MDRLRNFGFLLKDVTSRYVMRFEQRARGMSLTLPQCKALVRLENNEGVSQAKLCELAAAEPMTMVRILDHMEADGLLERRPDPSDRRARSLFLTEKAQPLLAEIWHLAELTRDEIFAGINRRDRDAFIDVLERIHQNACNLQELPPAPEAAQPAIKTRNGASRQPKA